MSPKFTDLSVTYDPLHHHMYPMRGEGNYKGLLEFILREDLNKIKNNFDTIRTYYTTHHGAEIVPIAAEVGLKVCLGVYMYGDDHPDHTRWREVEITKAIEAAHRYPNTVIGILVGNENVQLNDHNLPPNENPYMFSVESISSVIDRMRRKGVTVPIGTSQRYPDWMSTDTSIKRLAEKCDLIGVNVYPFYSPGWDSRYPTAILSGQWKSLKKKYSAHYKLCITETGWPTNGSAPREFPDSVPSFQNALDYFVDLDVWASRNETAGVYVFKYFDRREDDPSVKRLPGGKPNFEQFFGLCFSDGSPKFWTG